MYKVEVLKQRGNESFKRGKLNDALDLFAQAIELEKTASKPDTKTIAILYSNSTQIYLILKKYEKALESANNGIEIDPSFYKTNLRRAVAHLELGHLAESRSDALHVLQIEPKNMQALRVLRRLKKPLHINSQLEHAYIRHVLRRAIAKRISDQPFTHYNSTEEAFWRTVGVAIQRLAFVSTQSALQLRPFLNGCRIFDNFGEVTVVLPKWFPEKHMMYEPGGNQSTILVGRKTFAALFHSVRPKDLIFMFDDQSFNSSSVGLIYDFEEVIFMPVREVADFPQQKLIQCFRNAAPYLTQLPYFDGIEKLHTSYPRINSIIHVGNDEVSTKFLDMWQEKQWPVTTLIFNSFPMLKNFENYNGSTDLTNLYISLPDFQACDLSIFLYDQLETLKDAFPNLINVTAACTSYTNIGVQSFTSDLFSTKLLQHFLFLTRHFDQKPTWCPRMKIFSEYFIEFERFPGLYPLLQNELQNFVQDAQLNLPNINNITLTGPKMSTFGWSVAGCSFALIEMESEYTNFQVAFNANYRHEMFH
ncbi:hypothetical protein M3Y97_00179600 [Aphelenchoides bicaudatus]|nr:hypothetical protein M3Y97_00179600 [Aphelenchoides bicaudatus]